MRARNGECAQMDITDVWRWKEGAMNSARNSTPPCNLSIIVRTVMIKGDLFSEPKTLGQILNVEHILIGFLVFNL